NLQVSNNVVYGVSKLWTAAVPGVTTAATTFADPRLVNAVTQPYDFRLLASSPAADAGVRLPEVTVDYFGVARTDGRTDVGASEFAGGVIQQAATPVISSSGRGGTATVSIV